MVLTEAQVLLDSMVAQDLPDLKANQELLASLAALVALDLQDQSVAQDLKVNQVLLDSLAAQDLPDHKEDPDHKVDQDLLVKMEALVAQDPLVQLELHLI